MIRLYILNGRVPLRVSNFEMWANWFENADRQVAITRTPSSKKVGSPIVTVSTVFLGADHNWGTGPPKIFETMIFGGEHNKYRDRATTWEEAEVMHIEACVLAGITEAECR